MRRSRLFGSLTVTERGHSVPLGTRCEHTQRRPSRASHSDHIQCVLRIGYLQEPAALEESPSDHYEKWSFGMLAGRSAWRLLVVSQSFLSLWGTLTSIHILVSLEATDTYSNGFCP
ncbi:hypothetical protein AAFF_G00258440 [Aldrovandia affinis]|uniref:Uncharacterized protein n=1 Tax=Aldrovandia affinis TaxID=143900 RepID=A0AAD7STP0_9TELE|nr:hypothetical protein AAFF_G00258440 [Aldrovandia affinis]